MTRFHNFRRTIFKLYHHPQLPPPAASLCCCYHLSPPTPSNHFRVFRNNLTSYRTYITSAPADSSGSTYRAVFLGSDSFSLPSLIQLVNYLKPENVSVVVSNESNAISKYAKKIGTLKIYHWTEFKAADFGKRLADEGHVLFDFGVVASFGYLIPARVINRFPMGILNVHASLLPRWRGASPINHAIIHGDKETGISIMKIAPHRFDIGPVLLKKSVPLTEHMRAPELRQLLAEMGGAALIEVIKDLPHFLNNPATQDDRLATAAPKLTPEMAEIDWASQTAIEVYRLFRGLYGTYKLSSTFLGRKVDLDEVELPTSQLSDEGGDTGLKKDIKAISLEQLPKDSAFGQIVFVKGMMCVRCANSSLDCQTWIIVNKVKMGVKWMNATDFRNGFLSKGKLPRDTIPKFVSSKSSTMDEEKSFRSSL